MKVKFSIPSLQELEIDVPTAATVGQAKRKACGKLGLEPTLTSVLLDGRLIRETRKIKQLGHKKPLVLDYLWARHLILWGKDGQKRLREATVLLAGAGAIGNEVAKNLAMLGIKRLLVVDNDVVELSNTSRMIFFDRKHQGSNKAKVLARNITSKFPYVETLAWTGTLESLPLEHVLSADVIVCGLDNVLSRIYLSELSRKYSIPMVDGGIVGYQGRVQVYAPSDMPCPLCAFPSSDYALIAGLRNPCDGPAEDVKMPSLPTTISLVSSIQSQEATKLIIGFPTYSKKHRWPKETGEPLQGVLMIDLRYNRYNIVELKRNKNCVVCGDEGISKSPAPIISVQMKTLDHSTSRLHEEVMKSMNLKNGELMLFSQKRGRIVKIEKDCTTRQLGLGPGSVLTAIVRQGMDYREFIVRVLPP